MFITFILRDFSVFNNGLQRPKNKKASYGVNVTGLKDAYHYWLLSPIGRKPIRISVVLTFFTILD